MSDDLRTLLRGWKALEAAATEGPWSATYGPRELPRIWSDAPQFESAEPIAKCAFPGDVDDAKFIAASRTVVPHLIAAVEAVLEEHPRYEGDFSDFCGHCQARGEGTWPCPTVTAIHSALIRGDDE